MSTNKTTSSLKRSSSTRSDSRTGRQVQRFPFHEHIVSIINNPDRFRGRFEGLSAFLLLMTFSCFLQIWVPLTHIPLGRSHVCEPSAALRLRSGAHGQLEDITQHARCLRAAVGEETTKTGELLKKLGGESCWLRARLQIKLTFILFSRTSSSSSLVPVSCSVELPLQFIQ